MFKSCSKCGKIHDTRVKCDVGRVYNVTTESRLRSQYCWTKKSQQIRERANHLCEVCRANGVYTYDNIEVHHIVKVKDDQSKLLDDDNLICLCQEHHRMADDGQISKDELIRLVKIRESRNN